MHGSRGVASLFVGRRSAARRTRSCRGKFEWQFKRCDESTVNGTTAQPSDIRVATLARGGSPVPVTDC